jgi:fatty acyl-CoA reductase
MGQTFVERLLRVTEVETIHILLRPKKGKRPNERIKDLLSNGVCLKFNFSSKTLRILKQLHPQLFDTLKQQSNYEKVIEKITAVEGDCSLVNLGIEMSNWSSLCESVTLIYHFAATTRFDEKLKPATNLNLCGTHEMIKLARECKKLSLFCHISTAYCHLAETYLLEQPYAPPHDPHAFMDQVSQMTEGEAEIFKKKCLNATIPNTYVLTKSLAEALVVEALEKYELPVLILRPSIVTPTLNTPIEGWCPDFNGLGGLLIAVGKGVMRTMYCNEKFYGDFLPVDIATGGVMITTWNYLSLR